MPKFRHGASGLFAAIGMLFFAAAWSAAESPEFDLILEGGRIFDGGGGPSFEADVGVSGDQIMALGDLAERSAARRISAAGLTIAPGFIDIHSHADGSSPSGGLRSYSAKRRAAPNLVAQGVTTVVVNQDGRGPLDIGRQRGTIEESEVGVNAALMIGHNTVRRAVMKEDHKRPATPEELEAMADYVRTGMQDGAFGMTAGLEYVPGIWSTTQELVALVREITPYDGVYIAHERSSGVDPMWYMPSQHPDAQPTMLDSVLETTAIGEVTGAKVVVTHIKARGANYWGKSTAIIDAIARARARGVRIWADQYPYTTSGSDGLFTLVPYWILNHGGGEPDDYGEILSRLLKNERFAKAIRRDVAHQIERRGGAERIVVHDHPDASLLGRSLQEVADDRGVQPVDVALQFQFEGYPNRFGGVRVRGFSLSEDDVTAFMRQSWVATASDAGIAAPEDGPVHARHYGTFPRKLRRYALDGSTMGVADAIRSMTSLPADIMGFDDRGRVAVGYAADLVVIDLDTVRDLATFTQPHQFPVGIPYVFVNGVMVVDRGALTWALPGRVLLPRDSRDSD